MTIGTFTGLTSRWINRRSPATDRFDVAIDPAAIRLDGADDLVDRYAFENEAQDIALIYRRAHAAAVNWSEFQMRNVDEDTTFVDRTVNSFPTLPVDVGEQRKNAAMWTDELILATWGELDPFLDATLREMWAWRTVRVFAPSGPGYEECIYLVAIPPAESFLALFDRIDVSLEALGFEPTPEFEICDLHRLRPERELTSAFRGRHRRIPGEQLRRDLGL